MSRSSLASIASWSLTRVSAINSSWALISRWVGSSGFSRSSRSSCIFCIDNSVAAMRSFCASKSSRVGITGSSVVSRASPASTIWYWAAAIASSAAARSRDMVTSVAVSVSSAKASSASNTSTRAWATASSRVAMVGASSRATSCPGLTVCPSSTRISPMAPFIPNRRISRSGKARLPLVDTWFTMSPY